MLEPLIVPETGAVYRPITENLYLREPTPGDPGTYSDAIVFWDADGKREGRKANLLPRDAWELELSQDGRFVWAGVVTVGDSVLHTKMSLSSLPNDLIRAEDVERHGIILD